jgi:PAS domain S-box-containing protein
MELTNVTNEGGSFRKVAFLIGKQLKRFRKEKHLRQAELAEAVGLSNRHIQKIEAGQIDVRSSTISAFAESFNVPACYLLKTPDKGSLESVGIKCTFEVLDALHVGVQVVATDGLILYLNKKSLDILGFTKADTQRSHYVWDLLHDKAEVPTLKEYFKFLLKNTPRPSPYFTRNARKDGTAIPIKVDWDYLRNDDGKVTGFIVIIIPHPAW